MIVAGSTTKHAYKTEKPRAEMGAGGGYKKRSQPELEGVSRMSKARTLMVYLDCPWGRSGIRSLRLSTGASCICWWLALALSSKCPKLQFFLNVGLISALQGLAFISSVPQQTKGISWQSSSPGYKAQGGFLSAGALSREGPVFHGLISGPKQVQFSVRDAHSRQKGTSKPAAWNSGHSWACFSSDHALTRQAPPL
jgi:hypothetical protein